MEREREKARNKIVINREEEDIIVHILMVPKVIIRLIICWPKTQGDEREYG